jgi:uncharacterized membrane protein AbrB (regulator of aidB expression)
MIIIIACVPGLIALTVVVSVVILALKAVSIPDVLSNWGGIILGFYFGQSINLVRDYMGVITTNPPPQ